MNPEPLQDERLIDREVIGKLLEIQERTRDPDFFGSVLDLFFEHTPSLLTNLSDAAQQSDASNVQRIAHRLKGSSVSVGAAALADLCASMEHAAGSGAMECVTRDAARARDLYNRTQPLLTKFRNETSSSLMRRVPAHSIV